MASSLIGGACLIIEHALAAEDGTVPPEHQLYPITRVEKYVAPGQLSGVAEGGRDLSTRYALVLRAEFEPAGKRTGEDEHPVQDVYFKNLA